MRPSHFETTKVLGRLNLAGVALSLAGVTAAMVSLFLPGLVALVAGVSTLVFGALWGLVLRQPWSNGTANGARWGLLSCVVLAPLNAATMCGFLNALDPAAGPSAPVRFFEGMKVGAWDGALVWSIALVLTHVTFGSSLIRSHTLAREQGMVGVDRGERTVGRVCVLVAIIALALPAFAPKPFLDTPPDDAFLLPGTLFTRGAAVLGGVFGAIAASLAFARERRRKAFVADAETGKIEGYRVDTTDDAKVLVRVSPPSDAYREAEQVEEVYREDVGRGCGHERSADTIGETRGPRASSRECASVDEPDVILPLGRSRSREVARARGGERENAGHGGPTLLVRP